MATPVSATAQDKVSGACCPGFAEPAMVFLVHPIAGRRKGAASCVRAVSLSDAMDQENGSGAWRPCDFARARHLDMGRSREEHKLVRLAGIEPTTLGFGGQYS